MAADAVGEKFLCVPSRQHDMEVTESKERTDAASSTPTTAATGVILLLFG